MKIKWIFALILGGYFSLAVQAQNGLSPSLTPDSTAIPGAAVLFEGSPLFNLYERIGSITAKDRAKLASSRLEELMEKEAQIVQDSFKVLQEEYGYSIFYGKDIITLVSEDDAVAVGKSPQVAAEEYANTLFVALESASLLKQPKELAKRIGFFVGGLLGLFVFFWLLRRFFRWLQHKVEGLSRNLLFKSTVANKLFTFITPRRERHFWSFFFRLLKTVTIITTLVIYLPFLFRTLPWTHNFGDWLLMQIRKPISYIWSSFVDFLPDLIFIVVIVVITRYIIRFFSYLSREMEQEKIKIDGFYGDWARPTFKMVRFLIMAFALIIIFPYLPGSDSPAFQGVSIFLGLLFSLGSTSAISNMVAGVVITYMRPFVVGDRVKIGETVGDVMERTLLVTRIKTIKNVDITIPNSAILNNHLINYTKNAKDSGIVLHTTVTIGYDVPSQTVIDALVAGAKKTPRIEQDPAPFVLQTSLDDFYVSYEINATTKEASKMALIYSDLHNNIKDELHDAGVEILSPHYSAMRDGNALTVPPKNIPPDYKKSGFVIENPIEAILRTKNQNTENT